MLENPDPPSFEMTSFSCRERTARQTKSPRVPQHLFGATSIFNGKWNDTGVTTYKVMAPQKKNKGNAVSKRLDRSPCKTMSTRHWSPRRLTAYVFFSESRQRKRAETMPPFPRDIKSIVSKLELHILYRLWSRWRDHQHGA